MAISFPGSKSNGQKFTHQNKSWTWDGNSWKGGVSSGSDAGTLDSLNSTQFLRSDTSDTATGSYSFSNPYNEFGNSTGSVSNDGSWNARLNLAGSSHARLDVKSVSDGIITSMYSHTGHNAGKIGTYSNHQLKFIINGSDKATLSTAGSLSTTSQGTLWGASNDGSGSGLDADTVDGIQASSFLRSDASDTFTGSTLALGNYGSASMNLNFQVSQNGASNINFYDNNGTEGLFIHTENSTYGGKIHFGPRWNTDENAVTFHMLRSGAGGTHNGARVGIGTTSPDNTLTVNGGTESIGVQISETARLTLGADGTWNYFKGKSGNGHYFNTTGGGLVVLNNAGNVGIGTASPGYKLDVQGNFRSTGSIDASNYTGYFMWKGNGTSYDVNNRTTKVPYGTAVYSGYNAGANRPTTYDIALQVSASNRAMEFAADWVSSTAGPLYFRTLRDCCINWSSWSSISMSTVSDRRVKDNIVDYTSSEARTLIEQLQAVEYDYVNHDGTKGNVDLEDPDADLIARPREVGYIAQDVEDVIPYAVDFNPKGDTPNENGWASAYTVNYERLVPVLTEALKDVYSKLDSLQTQLDSANQEIQRLRDG